MATLSRGQSFSATEQVTNTKLHNLIDLGTISGITVNDMSASASIPDTMLQTISSAGKVSGSALTNLLSLPSAAGTIYPANLYDAVNFATNASLPNIARGSVFNLYYSTVASLATFLNPHTGQEISLVAQQASYPTLLDTGRFILDSNWIPQAAQDSIKLRYNGTNYYEMRRTLGGIAGVRFKLGTFTRDMTAASGNVAYTGVGFTPRIILFFGGVNDSFIGNYFGIDDGTVKQAMYNQGGDVAGRSSTTTTSVILRETAGNQQAAVVNSFDADGFTLAWTKSGTTSAGTANMFYIAIQ